MYKIFLSVFLLMILSVNVHADEPTNSERTFSVSSGLHDKENKKNYEQRRTQVFRNRNHLKNKPTYQKNQPLQYYRQRQYNNQ